ncbi:hypothetical protein BGZ57DRAFT_925369 [Hyaloscypha finlandica]|nr:hypothetical protein BGZ57DRAFT_925369 [Hyaloscypha finlandica]
MGQVLSTPTIPVEEPPSLKFTLFPKLPPELRNKIWEFALPGPRKITIETWDCVIVHVKLQHRHRQQQNKSDIPVTLHVCRDSRAIALKHYSLAFSYRLLRAVYFDFEIDTLHLVDEYALRAFTQSYDGEYEEERAELNVRSLRVGIEFETIRGHPFSRIKDFDALQHLTIEFYNLVPLARPLKDRDLVFAFRRRWLNDIYGWTKAAKVPKNTRLRYCYREFQLPQLVSANSEVFELPEDTL